jgi:hypothetical protein
MCSSKIVDDCGGQHQESAQHEVAGAAPLLLVH